MYMFLLEKIDSEKAVREACGDLDKLATLADARAEYWKKENKRLTPWLLNGSLVLGSYGDIGFFEPDRKKHFLDVVKFDKFSSGTTIFGDFYKKLPKSDSVCPVCGKGFTIMSAYNQDFFWIGESVCHNGECKEFYQLLIDTFKLTQELVLVAKKVFDNLENVSIDEGLNINKQIMKVSFTVLGNKISIFIYWVYRKPYCNIKYSYKEKVGIILSDTLYEIDKIESALQNWWMFRSKISKK